MDRQAERHTDKQPHWPDWKLKLLLLLVLSSHIRLSCAGNLPLTSDKRLRHSVCCTGCDITTDHTLTTPWRTHTHTHTHARTNARTYREIIIYCYSIITLYNNNNNNNIFSSRLTQYMQYLCVCVCVCVCVHINVQLSCSLFLCLMWYHCAWDCAFVMST